MSVVHTTDAEGNQYWLIDDKLHREDGPAIIRINGEQQWFKNGKFHRIDGPAIIYANGDQYWYNNGKYYRKPHNVEPMPVILDKAGSRASFNGKDYKPITPDEYEKYKYHPPGRYTKAALREN